MPRLILLRHGQSQWNLDNRFTGWVDVDLTAEGEAQARRAGEQIAAAGFRPSVMFTSVLKRATRTGALALDSAGLRDVPVIHDWRLNERHYGGLTGLNKAENLVTGFVDRSLKDVHAGHLCYATLSQTDLTLSDRKTGSMNLAVKKKHADDAAAKRKPDPAFEAMLKKKSQVTPLKADQEWHVYTLVTEGDEMRFSLDGKLIASHRSEGYAHDMKRWFSFLANSTVWIDDVKIYKVR